MFSLDSFIRSKSALILECSSRIPGVEELQSGGKDYLSVQLSPADGTDYIGIACVDPTLGWHVSVILTEEQITQLIKVLNSKLNLIKQETPDGN